MARAGSVPRVNTLILAQRACVPALLHGLGVGRSAAVGCWPREDAPWCRGRSVRTIVLLDPEQLDDVNQERLFHWLHDDGRDVRVVSIIFQPLFPLVVSGRFCQDLYYRLNTRFVSCAEGRPLFDRLFWAAADDGEPV